MGQCQAVQVEIVSLLALRTGRGFDCASSSSQHRQESILYLSAELLIQADQVVRRSGNAALPQQAVCGHIDCLQGNRQLIALPAEVSSEQPSDVQFRAHLVRVEVDCHIPAGYGRRAHFERAGVCQHTGQLIG